MRRFRNAALILASSVGPLACGDDPYSPPEDSEPSLVASRDHGADIVPLWRTPAPAAGSSVGRSRVFRSANGIRLKLETGLLARGTASTVWAVVFNNPTACASSPCSSADLGVPAVNGRVVYAAGGLTMGTRSNYHGTLAGGDPAGLVDPLTAEVHFLLRSHGPAIPGLSDEQISTPGGGCQVFVTPAIPTQVGECADVAFAIHLP